MTPVDIRHDKNECIWTHKRNPITQRHRGKKSSLITYAMSSTFLQWMIRENGLTCPTWRQSWQHNNSHCGFHCVHLVNPLQWRHNEHDGVSNHQPNDYLLNRLFRRRWKKTPKLRVTGLLRGTHRWPINSPHKGPVTRKMFLFDDVIMDINELTFFDGPGRVLVAKSYVGAQGERPRQVIKCHGLV